MSNVKTRKSYAPSFKAKLALEAVRETQTLNELGQAHGVHPVQVGQWKKRLVEQAAALFDGPRGPAPGSENAEVERLYQEIGRLTMELDWLKKKSGLNPTR